MRVLILAGCVFIVSIFLMTKYPGAELVDRIVAVVNNDIISLQDLNRIMKPYAERIKKSSYSAEKEQKMLFEIRRKILNQLIDQKLTDQELQKHSITVSAREIDRTIERIKEMAAITDEEMRAGLAEQGLTMKEYRERTKEQLLRRKLIRVSLDTISRLIAFSSRIA